MKRVYCIAIAALLVFGIASADEAAKKLEGEMNQGLPATNALLCEGAIPISCGDVVAGDNLTGVSTADVYGCVTWTESAPEAIYELVLATDQVVTVAISGMTADLDVFILSACDEGSCVDYGDAGFTTDCLTAGTYLIVVDGYNGATSAFDLAVSCVSCEIVDPCDPPVNDVCATAMVVTCGGFYDENCTELGVNDYTPTDDFSGGCTGYYAQGPDLAYRLDLAGGESVHIEWLTTADDGSVYIITDCADAQNTCVAGADATFSGDVETLDWVAPGAGTYYVIGDSFSSSSTGGPTTMTINYDCSTATENSNWGEVKSLFR